MKKTTNKVTIAIVLIAFSVLLYVLQNIIFNKPNETVFYFFQDLAFLPIEVLLVTLILDGIIKEREKRNRMLEINIVVGAFFSEMGADAIRRMKPFITNMEGIMDKVEISGTFGPRDFENSADAVAKYDFQADSTLGNLRDLGNFLKEKNSTTLGMFENPNLLENSRFTSMLWAVYHVMDEIQNRDDISALPQSDLDHLSGDLQRAFCLLVVEWILYMEHMKSKYPYLFSLAVRKNPFLEKPSVVIY